MDVPKYTRGADSAPLSAPLSVVRTDIALRLTRLLLDLIEEYRRQGVQGLSRIDAALDFLIAHEFETEIRRAAGGVIRRRAPTRTEKRSVMQSTLVKRSVITLEETQALRLLALHITRP